MTDTRQLIVDYATPPSSNQIPIFDGSKWAPGNLSSILDADLNAIAALSGTDGVLCKTAANTWALRAVSAPAAGITVTNPRGIAGDITLALADDLAALENQSGTGLVARTANATYAQRTITGTTNQITVTNGNGVSGNPTLALDATLVASLASDAKVLSESGLISTTSGSMTQMMTGDITVNVKSGQKVFVIAWFMWSAGTVGADCAWEITQDGSRTGQALTQDNQVSNTSGYASSGCFFALDSPSAGDHVYTVRWQVSSGTVYNLRRMLVAIPFKAS